MRNWNAVFATALAMSWLWAAAAESVTMAEWADTPLTIGDQKYTLIETDWASDTDVSVERGQGMVYAWTLDTAAAPLANETRTVIYRVTIIDDPATPGDETAVYAYDHVALYENHGIFGSVQYRIDLDNDSDFSSPQVTYITGIDFGPFPFGGSHQELYVRLIIEVAEPVLIDYVTISLWQTEDPVPVEAASFGSIKSLFR